jgi:hypothetical protein
MLYRDDEELSLAPKVVKTLAVLVVQAGTIISKDGLIERVWDDSIVEESNLTQYLYLLRKTLHPCRMVVRESKVSPGATAAPAETFSSYSCNRSDPVFADLPFHRNAPAACGANGTAFVQKQTPNGKR